MIRAGDGEMEACPPGKVLFLDVDGVLNRCGFPADVLTEKVLLLKRIVAGTGCAVVVSSTWRTSERMRELLVRLLGEHCISISDWTPCLDGVNDAGLFVRSERHHEIQAWLDRYPAVERFVILDDLGDMGHLQSWLVQTESSVGLTSATADEVIARLG